MNHKELFEKISARFQESVLGSSDRYGSLEIQIERSQIARIVQTLRDDPEFAFDMLIDLVSLDYSAMPNFSGDRFGVSYLLKSLGLGHRLQLKSFAPEDDPSFPTISGLYANADWLEREAFDQMGLRFPGHPNLKRILNHHEFVGHPLRKDYPITRRQALSSNESLMDEMAVRLGTKGYE